MQLLQSPLFLFTVLATPSIIVSLLSQADNIELSTGYRICQTLAGTGATSKHTALLSSFPDSGFDKILNSLTFHFRNTVCVFAHVCVYVCVRTSDVKCQM